MVMEHQATEELAAQVVVVTETNGILAVQPVAVQILVAVVEVIRN
jgi:hypothetical protein